MTEIGQQKPRVEILVVFVRIVHMEKHPLHIKNPEFQTSEEVQDAVEKQERLTEEKIPNNPSERIEAYTDRLEDVFLNEDKRVRERNLELFRDKIYDTLIIKKENFPESYFELQKRIARERGQHVEEIPQDVREQIIDTAIQDQKVSLDAWIDYLTSDDAVYPAWFKYYAWTQITKLSQFDKERGEFKKRTESTVAPFPDIYREPLAQIADLYGRVKDNNKDSEARREFDKKFPSLYAELISKSLATSMESREEIRGQWVKYEQGDNQAAEKLFQSLVGKGTGWCTAGKTTADTQIKSGDFYVYYTNDSSGEPTQPRLAIRMKGHSKIGEVRGILPHQGVEPLMQEVLDEKLKKFGPEADAYRKKSEDMRLLTNLERKHEKGEPFTKDDLVFLYEINSPIVGFGYHRDPRIDELLSKRNKKEDTSMLLDCSVDQIAETKEELNNNSIAYVGVWEPGVLKFLPPGIKYVYEEFPKKKAFLQTVETDPNIITPEDAIRLLKEHNSASKEAEALIRKMKFSDNKKTYKLAAFSGAELFSEKKTSNRISLRVIALKSRELGLKLCPVEIVPFLRAQYAGDLQDRFEYLTVFDSEPAGYNGANLFALKHKNHPGYPDHDDLIVRKTSSSGWDYEVSVNELFIFQY